MSEEANVVVGSIGDEATKDEMEQGLAPLSQKSEVHIGVTAGDSYCVLRCVRFVEICRLAAAAECMRD